MLPAYGVQLRSAWTFIRTTVEGKRQHLKASQCLTRQDLGGYILRGGAAHVGNHAVEFVSFQVGLHRLLYSHTLQSLLASCASNQQQLSTIAEYGCCTPEGFRNKQHHLDRAAEQEYPTIFAC